MQICNETAREIVSQLTVGLITSLCYFPTGYSVVRRGRKLKLEMKEWKRTRGGCAHRRARYTFYCRWKDDLLESVAVTGAINPLDPSSTVFLFSIPRERNLFVRDSTTRNPVTFNIISKSDNFVPFPLFFLSCRYYLAPQGNRCLL